MKKCVQQLYLTYVYFFYLRLKIVDDDIDWKQTVKEEEEIIEDEEEAPVVRI